MEYKYSRYRLGLILVGISLLMAATLLSSCSVKEDRQGCPCTVTIMSDGQIHRGHDGDLTVSVFNGVQPLKTICRERITLGSFVEGTADFRVPKGWFMTSGIGGPAGNMELVRDTILCIPSGCQCDSVCAFSTVEFAGVSDDSYVVRAPLNKQFCTITVALKDGNGKDAAGSVRFTGNVDGFNILTLGPHSGSFAYETASDEDGLFKVRVPRQKDDSLILQPVDAGEGVPSDGIRIGMMISDAGYNWNNISLDDVELTIDYVNATFTVNVDGWQSGRTYNFEI